MHSLHHAVNSNLVFSLHLCRRKLYGHPTHTSCRDITGNSVHGHTSSSACHVRMLLICSGRREGLHCASVLLNHTSVFRRRCDFSSTTADRALLVAHPSLDRRAAKGSDQTNPVCPRTIGHAGRRGSTDTNYRI